MKLMLHELKGAIEGLRADELAARVQDAGARLAHHGAVVQAWSVLATMTPSEYTVLRPYLGTSSGFQSFQYREIEFRLGNKNRAMLAPHAGTPPSRRAATGLAEPSLYDEAIAALARRGFSIDPRSCAAISARSSRRMKACKRPGPRSTGSPRANFDLYELAEELVDLEDAFRLWRFRHVTTVERIIGFKRGTGGTAGVGYLRKMLDVVLFPELWRLRTEL